MKIERTTKEVNISLEYIHTIGYRPKIIIHGTGDMSHHLIEETFKILEDLSKTQDCCHRAKEYYER